MYLHGEFVSQRGATIAVYILTNGDKTTEVEIGGEDSNVQFSDDPVEITSEVNDTFDVLLPSSCSIRLQTREYLPDLFCASAKDAVVNIYKDDECVFAGYIEPQSYSQPYNDAWDELELNCIDALSALQYSNYRGIGTSAADYDTVKSAADQRTFLNLITEALDDATSAVDILGSHTVQYLYDGSKAIDGSSDPYDIFASLSLSELLFLGEDEDDVWTQEDMLTELLKYLNLHIVQCGFTFYLFSWESVKSDDDITFKPLSDGAVETITPDTITISMDNVADDGAQISIGEVYNQLLLTCEREETETVIESPLDDDNLQPLYSGRQLYLSEFISEGSGDHAHDAMIDMVNGNSTTYGGASEIDWYLQAMYPKNWKLFYDGTNTVDTLVEKSSGRAINQWKLPQYLRQNTCVPMIFSMGSVERQTSANDNSPTSKIDMSTYLFISVNGNEYDTEVNCSPTESDLQSHSPLMEYTGNVSGGTYSPSDEATTNYLVFSGSILLQPVAYESTQNSPAARSNSFYSILTNGMRKTESNDARVPYYNAQSPLDNIFSSNLVRSDNNGEGRYYTRKFYTFTNPTDKKADYPDNYLKDGTMSLHPWTEDKSAHGYEFKYSATGDGTDKYSKLPVLECELIIGNKRLVETDIDEYGNSTFKWYKLGSEPTGTYVDDDGVTQTYTMTTFSLGINPAIGDYIIGDEFDIQNTIDYTMNIDAEGTAIPITKADAVSGRVTFRVLGAINTTWNDISRRHPSFWRHTKWSSDVHYILSHTENIIIKDFECKVYSDNGLITGTDDQDLVYISDTDETFFNKKDDLEMKINSALTSAECASLGLSQSVCLSTPWDVNNQEGLLSVYDVNKNETGKAEQHYVDSYYTEYHAPRVLLDQHLNDDAGVAALFNHYRHAALDKTFFVQSLGRNLIEGRADLVLKEIETE